MAEIRSLLPNGSNSIALERQYTSQESGGMIVLIGASSASLLAVAILLGAIAVSAAGPRGTLKKHLFLRTHVAGYFFSLMLCHIIQAIASMMSIRWVVHGGLEAGSWCVAQGVLKQASDVGTALWTLIIAIHTFCLLFWEMEGLSIYMLWATLIGGWSAIGAIVVSGPAVLSVGKLDQFFGISGYWCWIIPQHETQQITHDWLILLVVVVSCFVLYTLISLRLRGVIIREGWRIRFTRITVENVAIRQDLPIEYSVQVAKQMLLYPITYAVLILPIVTARLIESSGKDVALAGMICSDAIYQMFGIANVILFATTRPVLSREPAFSRTWSISWPFEHGRSAESRHTIATVPIQEPPQPPETMVQIDRFSFITSERPTWTQRDVKQPPRLTLRDSIGSIYKIYDEVGGLQPEPRPSSRWSANTSLRSAKR